jgi:hypothetical protein
VLQDSKNFKKKLAAKENAIKRLKKYWQFTLIDSQFFTLIATVFLSLHSGTRTYYHD